jgi:hypothetical protein
MLTRALDAGVVARWVAGDEVYGADPALRAELEFRQVGYVLAIGCDRRVPTAAGPIRADALTASLPRRAWQRLSAGAGAKGQRYYDWAWVSLTPPAGCARPGGCWSAATATPASWRSTAATARNLSRCASWSGSPDALDGRGIPPSQQGLAGLDEHSTQSVSPSRSVSRQRQCADLATVS